MINICQNSLVYGVPEIVELLYNTNWLVVFTSQAKELGGFGLHLTCLD